MILENGHRDGRVGILGPRGDIEEHSRSLQALGVEPVEVEVVEDLDGLNALIIAGEDPRSFGEKLFEAGLLDGVRTFFYGGGAVWGSCAGMVLAASATTGDRQPLIGLMNALAVREGFETPPFEVDLEVEGFEEPFVGIFIEAPYLEDTGPGVEPLARLGGKVVAARAENVLVTAFHPELTDDVRFHRYFLQEVCRI